MASITLYDITKQYDDITVIKNLNLAIEDGSFTVLVGPSGCGKSTTLRMIAGLEKINSGRVLIGDRDVTEETPGNRQIAMVFQNYALYPTMTVKENIEFGLKNKKVPKKERETIISEICEIVGLTEYLNRKPGNLSGGQRQRVALARAMVKKPKVFLMDEPLSNLDAKLRNQMRTELIQLHKRLGSTFVYVTHDQVEAMSMGDKIVVMNEGKIQQVSDPITLYKEPENLFTAQFIGSPPMNILDLGSSYKEFKYIGFRPEDAVVSKDNKKDSLSIAGRIITREVLGSETIYYIETKIGKIKIKSFGEIFQEDIMINLNINYSNINVFDQNGNRLQKMEEESMLKILEVNDNASVA